MAGISASAEVAHESEELGVVTELGCSALWLRTEQRLWVRGQTWACAVCSEDQKSTDHSCFEVETFIYWALSSCWALSSFSLPIQPSSTSLLGARNEFI